MQGNDHYRCQFYAKKLNNHAVRMAHSLYSRKAFDECSLMNMWVSDFLYNHRGEDVFQKDIEAEFFITRATASKMLTLMEEKHLIRRTSMEQDGCAVIEPEPRGVQLHEMCLTIPRGGRTALYRRADLGRGRAVQGAVPQDPAKHGMSFLPI